MPTDRLAVKTPNSLVWQWATWDARKLAILAYRQFAESRPLPILAFKDPQVTLEGAMTALTANPQPLPPASQLPSLVLGWLKSEEFAESSGDAFLNKWEELNHPARQVIAVLLEEGKQRVRESSVRQGLVKRISVDGNAADSQLREAKLYFIRTHS